MLLQDTEMNSRSIATFILSTCIITAAKGGSHFELIRNSEQQIGEQGSVSGMFLHKTHFQCDREPKCTHVIKHDGSEEHVMVHGEDALKKMTHVATIWKKMAINAIQNERNIQQNISNIALGKPVALSSILGNLTNMIRRAVDGEKKILDGLCLASVSNIEENAWLRVDLQAAALVKSVSIVSWRGEPRMKAIDVRAGNIFKDGGVGNPPCQLNVTIPANSTSVHVQCPSDMTARYVTVNTRGRYDRIIICEIEVYGNYV